MAEQRYPVIIFDWDGTLMDSAAAIVESIQAACRDLALPEPPDDRARHVIGLGLVDAMRHAVPELTEDRYSAMVDRYRHHYLSRDHELVLFAGVREMLDQLAAAGHFLAVATGKSRLGLSRALQVSGLAPCFHATRCADECHSKPHPQMLEELLAEFDVSPAQALMIGDTTHDLQMAENAVVDSVGVTYGAHPGTAFTSFAPRFVASNVPELSAWLKANA